MNYPHPPEVRVNIQPSPHSMQHTDDATRIVSASTSNHFALMFRAGGVWATQGRSKTG